MFGWLRSLFRRREETQRDPIGPASAYMSRTGSHPDWNNGATEVFPVITPMTPGQKARARAAEHRYHNRSI